MGCYCSEIRKCRNDISILNSVESLFNKADGFNSNDIYNSLINISKNTEDSISPDNLNSLLECERKINDNVRREVEELIWECQKKKSELEERLRSMISSDKAYHRRKKKNN